MQELKIIGTALLGVALVLLILAAKYRMNESPTGDDQTYKSSSMLLVLAVCSIIASVAIGIKLRKDDGLKTSDYIQITVVALAVILIFMAYLNNGTNTTKMLTAFLALLAAAQLLDF